MSIRRHLFHKAEREHFPRHFVRLQLLQYLNQKKNRNQKGQINISHGHGCKNSLQGIGKSNSVTDKNNKTPKLSGVCPTKQDCSASENSSIRSHSNWQGVLAKGWVPDQRSRRETDPGCKRQGSAPEKGRSLQRKVPGRGGACKTNK